MPLCPTCNLKYPDDGHCPACHSTIQAAAEKMKNEGVGDLPVVVGGDLVGMITDRDIVVRVISHGQNPADAKVVDGMTEGVVTCQEEDDIETAAEKMASHQIRRLAVKGADGSLTGILSLGDLALHLNRDKVGNVLRQISQ